MDDSAYIKPSARGNNRQYINVHGMYEDLAASHIVADDVMRELAEALRRVPHKEWSVIGTALARYDKLVREGGGNPSSYRFCIRCEQRYGVDEHHRCTKPGDLLAGRE